MEPSEIMNELRQFIRTEFNVSEDDPDFSDNVNLFDFGYIDSFGAVALTSFVETKFAIKITDSDLVAFPLNSILEIASFIVKRRKGEI